VPHIIDWEVFEFFVFLGNKISFFSSIILYLNN